jgi:RNA polymerase sigma factor (sigma-70 family)
MNEAKFTFVYKANVKDLYNYGIRLGFSDEICMDALHDVFYKVLVSNKMLDDNSIRPYLFKSLRNRLIDLMNLKDEQNNEDVSKLPFTVDVNIMDKMIEDEEMESLRQKVASLMNLLSDRQREIVYLRYMEEMEYEEIGKLLKMKSESVRKAVFRSIKLIRQLLK